MRAHAEGDNRMDKPIYEIPAIQPGDSLSWWDPIAAGQGDVIDVEPAAEAAAGSDTRAVDTVRLASVPGDFASGAIGDPGLADSDGLDTEQLDTIADGHFAAKGKVFELGSLHVPSGRRASIQVDPSKPGAPVRMVHPPVIGPDGRQADPDLIEALTLVLELEASDLHITVGAPPTIRVDGALRPIEGLAAWSPEKVSAALYSIISIGDRVRFGEERELDFAYTAVGARFRVNFYHQRNSIGGAFRLIPREIKPLNMLGVPESVGRFSLLPRGLVLVTGPTGSGKSTTLAAMVDLANSTRPDHIVTVEDPIEFLHRHKKSLVNQREVGHDTHSFAAALKHVLRQDPDIILIGELRDLETISVALTAAETGHLVFATLHTQDAAQTIDRVIDVFPPHQQGQVRTQLAATLRGVVCQTLVKKANGKGRVVSTEILVTTPAIANLIREGKTHQITSMMQAGGAEGMHTMDQHLAELVDTGQITRQAAMDKAHDMDSLAQLIKRSDTTMDADSRSMSGGIDYGDNYSTPRR